MENKDSRLVEIDIFSMAKSLWKKKLLIIAFAFGCALSALVYSMFLVNPEYKATSRIYVVSKQNENTTAFSNTDLQAAAYLVKDYKEIILSESVLSEVSYYLNLNMSAEELSRKLYVGVPTDTRILSITATDEDPEEAARIANAVRDVASQKIIEVTKVSDVTTIDEASVPTKPSSPQIRKNVFLGFGLGIIFIIMILSVLEIMDDHVKRPEDIEETMGLSLLGIIPDVDKL